MPRLDLERFQDLVKKDLIPKQQLDTQDSLVHQYEGAVKADQGQIDNAKLQLVYCRIIAPISGRIGLRQVDAGQHRACDRRRRACGHHPDAADLGDLFPAGRQSLAGIGQAQERGSGLSVEAYDRDQKQKLATGSLLTVDNQIDPNTGTVKLKADVPEYEQ